MADERDPQNERDPRNLRGYPDRNDLERRRATAGAWWAWWWLWLVIIAFIIWFGGWGWGPYGGWWGWGAPRNATVEPGPAGATATSKTPTPAPAGSSLNQTSDAIAVLTSPAKQSYIGKKVQLKHVKVQGASGKALWVGPSGSQKLLVVQQKENPHAGQPPQNSEVNVSGTVEKAPAANRAEKDWGLSGGDAQQVEKDGVYISANQVQPLQPR
jgi:hypothetical protein